MLFFWDFRIYFSLFFLLWFFGVNPAFNENDLIKFSFTYDNGSFAEFSWVVRFRYLCNEIVNFLLLYASLLDTTIVIIQFNVDRWFNYVEVREKKKYVESNPELC